MGRNKYYVVWAGHDTGVFDSWDECRLQVEGFPEARYKAFPTREAAVEAYRADPLSDDLDVIRSIASHEQPVINFQAFPDIIPDAIAVDAACSRNPGPVEYRGVSLRTGQQIFHIGPLKGGTNNIGEFLAIVHALALLEKKGDTTTVIYSDSVSGMAWVRNKMAKTTLTPTPDNGYVRELIKRAEIWLRTHTVRNRVLKWQTEKWGEIPADFGRK